MLNYVTPNLDIWAPLPHFVSALKGRRNAVPANSAKHPEPAGRATSQWLLAQNLIAFGH